MLALDDIGKFGTYCFANPQKTKGEILYVASDSPTMQDVADIFSRVTGLKAKYEPMTLEQFRDTHRAKVNVIKDSIYVSFVGNMIKLIHYHSNDHD